MARASKKGKGMGDGQVVGHPHTGPVGPEVLDEDDLANEIKGRNALHGQDQGRNHNQRLTNPGAQDLRNQPD